MLRFLLFLIILLVASPGYSQTIDPYRAINDPFALAYLKGCDTSVLNCMISNAGPGLVDQDGYYVLATDTGSGIVRHMWFTYDWGHAKPTDSLKIFIDDSLVGYGQAEAFFEQQSGNFRAPLDTAIAGGKVIQRQLGYKRNFTVCFKKGYLFRAIFWQRLPIDSVESFLSRDRGPAGYESIAEKNFSHSAPVWVNQSPTIRTATIPPMATYTLLDTAGPGIIQALRINPGTLDSIALRAVRIRANWDENPFPAIEVPLADFFGAGSGVKEIHSIRMSSSREGGFECYFPMPYRHHATLQLVNGSSTPFAFTYSIDLVNRPVDGGFGYMCTQFNSSPQIRRKQYHPVAHVKGRGKFVGEFVMMQPLPVPYFLEGDPVLVVDSGQAPLSTIHYIGTEDYFNGGWYFLDSAFSLPFCGCPTKWTCMYRFHLNDAINFRQSFDFRLGHGFQDDDFRADYRSVSFFYLDWLPYWVVSDTISAQNDLIVRGSGYRAREAISATIDSLLVYDGVADTQGKFQTHIHLSSLVPNGPHQLQVNRIAYPRPIIVTSSPQLNFLQDSIGQKAIWRDSIIVHGEGFRPQELLALSLGDSVVAQMFTIDSTGHFWKKIYIPWMDNGIYRFRVSRSDGSIVLSDSTLEIQRNLNFEIEDLKETRGNGTYSYIGYIPQYWSNSTIIFAYGQPDSINQWLFDVPYEGSFDLTFYCTTGDRFGIYDVSIDSVHRAVIDPFRNWPWGILSRSPFALGIMNLSRGLHTLTCICKGRDLAAVEYSFGPDNLLLKDVAPFESLVSVNRADVVTPYRIFPNPVHSSRFRLLKNPPVRDNRIIFVQVYDQTGRIIETIKPVSDLNELGQEFMTPVLPPGAYYLAITSQDHVLTYLPVVLE